MKFSVGGKFIGDGEPCFIIAEAGVNHNGNVEIAREMIDAAKESGADAIKFQTFKSESVVSRDAEKAEYQKESTGDGSQYEMIKKLELSPEDFKMLADYAADQGIIFLSTPFDLSSVDVLSQLGVPAFKIASGEITNFQLLKRVAEKGKPIILSTGMASIGEIEEAIHTLQGDGAQDIILLHCTTSYPANFEDLNLRAIQTLSLVFDLPIGYSDHSLGIVAPVAAVSLGACMIEKHFTLDKNMEGPDHRASLEPEELEEMVQSIRTVEQALGDGIKRPTPEEEKVKPLVRRSIFAKVDIAEGEAIQEHMLEMKRPGTGLQPRLLDKIVGKKAISQIQKDTMIQPEMIEKLDTHIDADDIVLSNASEDDYDFFFRIKSEYKNILWTGHASVPKKESMRRWFVNTVAGETKDIYVINHCGRKAGYLYLERLPDDHIEISVAVTEQFEGMGIATISIGKFVEMICQLYPDADIIAWVLENNHASVKAFTKNNFMPTEETRIANIPLKGTEEVMRKYHYQRAGE